MVVQDNITYDDLYAENLALKELVVELKTQIRKDQSQMSRDILEGETIQVVQNIAQYFYTVHFNQLGEVTSTYHSPQCIAVTGYDPKEYADNSNLWINMVYQEDREEVGLFIKNLKENLSSGTIEHRIIRKDGEIRWVANHCILSREETRFHQVDGFIVDLTERKRGEKAISLLAALVESAEDAIISESLDTTITSWNQGAERIFGYTAHEIVGQSITCLAPEGYEDEPYKILSDIKKGNNYTLFHTVRRAKDGRLVDVSLTVSPIKDLKNNIIGASMIARDMTHRIKLYNGLMESEKKYRDIVNLTSEGYCMLDANQKFIEVNNFLCVMLGYTQDELIDCSLFEFVHENEREHAVKKCSQISQAPYHWFDLTLKTKSGKKVYTQFNTTTMRDRSGQPMKSFSFITDITELKDKNDALRESEERLQAILLSSPDILLVLDEDLQVNEVFTARNDLLWMPKDEMLGQNLKSISAGKAYEAIKAGLKKLKQSSEPISIEYSVNINNHTKWFSALASKLVSKQASEEKIILVIRDQTEQKRIERLREDVERIVRHDLKSPLNGIIGYSQLLLRGSLSDEQRKKVTGIHDEGNSMLHMINYSLDLFKMEEGAYIYTPVEVDIVQILSRIDNELSTLKDARHLHAEYKLMGKLIDWEQSFFIPGESMLLTNLFANLIKNALEASPEHETITISISEKKDFYGVNIHNMGIIPKEVEKRFFDRYTTTKKYGTGIGTYSAFLITKVHRGRIEFTSSQEEGTHLVVSLPKTQDLQTKVEKLII